MAMADLMGDVTALRHPGLAVDLSTGVVRLTYELEGATATQRFTETLVFPLPDRMPDRPTLDAFHRVLELLYLAAGTSYYKITAPPRITVDSFRLAASALPWAVALYRLGLAEFAYRNDLPHVLDLPVDVATGADAESTSDRLDTGRAPLVAIGGGKDSIVSVEALKEAGLRPVLFSVKPNTLIHTVAAATGCPMLAVGRSLDPRLFELNAAGAYNGHIPVTAINSLIGVATALLHDLGPVVMSNESSASMPNLTWHGHEVNHQWSKGLGAETLLRTALQAHAGISSAYFSILRGFSELSIAKLFARTTAYDTVLSSCNRAYRIGETNPRRWCGTCDKCRFVFLALAPFMSRQRLVTIFDADLLDDPAQLPGYRELCGLNAHKPFECVGDTEECLVALRLLTQHPEWSRAAVVGRLREEVPADRWPSDAVVARVLAGDGPHHVPDQYAHVVAALRAAAQSQHTPQRAPLPQL